MYIQPKNWMQTSVEAATLALAKHKVTSQYCLERQTWPWGQSRMSKGMRSWQIHLAGTVTLGQLLEKLLETERECSSNLSCAFHRCPAARVSHTHWLMWPEINKHIRSLCYVHFRGKKEREESSWESEVPESAQRSIIFIL